MEKTKKTSARASQSSREAIKESYRETLLTDGKQPASVFAFCKKLGIKESEFYKHFSSFESIEKAVWTDHLETVKQKLESDKDYAAFTSREKILTFYFSLAELLKTDRSFLIHQLKSWKNPAVLPGFLKGFQQAFAAWAKPVIESGVQAGDIAKRPYLDQQYHHLLWMHFLFILQFWAHDESPDFEKTDAAIEKSVNLAFDLIGKGILDNAIDFGKFLYQTSKN
jgi:AcrR family transcriptional regulator